MTYHIVRVVYPKQESNIHPPACTIRLLYPLLSLLQSQQPRIALAPLVFRSHKRSYNRIVRHIAQCLLIRLHCLWQPVEFWPINLLVSAAWSGETLLD